MAKIWVKSDPYLRIISFERFDEATELWIAINEEHNPNSRLISEEYKIGFFPFKVAEIVNCIMEEYGRQNEDLTIVFSGSDDEYRELENILTDQEFSGVNLEKGEGYIENARDVLPDVNRIFSKLCPLILKNIEDEDGAIQQQLNRFSDASNDTVPICVLGTYSAGKSTFINSLIGCELLPSAETPATAKIYKICSLPHKDRAIIRFTFDEAGVSISFRGDKLVVEGLADDEELLEDIYDVLETDESLTIIEKVHLVLEEINDSGSKIGDLIEINVPFGTSTLDEINTKIAIFDTPGSNSSTNLQHSNVLDAAMKGMSNGLPIFVTDSTSMDSTDNDNLKDKLKEVSGLDSRFTMIVVNKAEIADLSLRKFQRESFRRKIMNQSIPRELYAQGIFYVSSILGLGAKRNGQLNGEFYSEQFDTYKDKYLDRENPYYKRLFDFNIIPKQLKPVMVKNAEEHPNLIYANSGLLSIEDTIKDFVNKYSHYDKCQQARKCLDNLMLKTETEIEEKNDDFIGRKLELQNSLDSQKVAVIETLETTVFQERNNAIERYPKEMSQFLHYLSEELNKEEIDNEYNHLYHLALSEEPASATDVGKSSQVIEETDFFTKLRHRVEDYKESETKRRKIEETASVQLLEIVKEKFSQELVIAKERFNNFSKDFLVNATSDIRRTLEDIIAGGLDLPSEKRKELSDIIINYEEIDFNQFDLGKFNRDELSYIFRIGDYRLKSSRINISGLTKTYNREFKGKLLEFSETIESEHEKKFKNWVQDLVILVKNNIIEFSPELKEKDEKIQKIMKEIYSLEEQQKQMKAYAQEIKRMISWK